MHNRIGHMTAGVLLVGVLIGVLGPMSVASASNLERSATPPPLSTAEADALSQAIHEEYLALNTYQAVLTQLGSITPFSRVALSEKQHVEALSALFAKYGLETPGNPGLSPAPDFANRKAACQAGVDIEIADAALYDALLPVVANRADLVQVFTNLQAASLDNHLPAFDNCN